MRPLLVIGSTSHHRKDLSSSLIIRSTLTIGKASRHPEYLLSSGVPLVIEKTSRHRQYVLSSGVPLIIGKTSRHLDPGSTSHHRNYGLPLVILSTSYHEEYLLSSERPLVIENTSYHRRDLFL